jgi:hypothetical protein
LTFACASHRYGQVSSILGLRQRAPLRLALCGALFAFIFYRDVSCAPPAAGRPSRAARPIGAGGATAVRPPTGRPPPPPRGGGPRPAARGGGRPPPRRPPHGWLPRPRYAGAGGTTRPPRLRRGAQYVPTTRQHNKSRDKASRSGATTRRAHNTEET